MTFKIYLTFVYIRVYTVFAATFLVFGARSKCLKLMSNQTAAKVCSCVKPLFLYVHCIHFVTSDDGEVQTPL